ncbi:CDP-alcohol phosphatidyltransferase family protein [Alloscardovia criceti]|uniref:CDP-alcohol phosphatidyltransferase family protein n=1 Tax=Alloscardovia criceti TaxID=356828 RepID=UPI0003635371|nr:CDP-alcohol phosphatidyltransferase family protein [Alloscardovia criceti]
MTEELNAQDEERLKLKPSNRIVTWPNFVSLIRLLTIPVIAILIDRGELVLGLVMLAVSGLTDALDGFLARRLNQITKLGQILDPIADRLLICCSILALGFADLLPWWFIIVVGARDIMLAVLVFVLAQYDYGPLPVHFVGKTATAMIMVDIPTLIISGIGSGPIFTVMQDFGVALAVWGIALYWVAGIIYVHQGIRLIIKTRREMAQHADIQGTFTQTDTAEADTVEQPHVYESVNHAE